MGGARGGPVGRRGFLRALGAGGTAAVAGCAGNTVPRSDGSDESADGRLGGTFVAAQITEGGSLSPYDFGDEATESRLYRLFDGGYRITENQEPEPRWFAQWTLADSADVVEYELQDSLRYGRGYGPLTAEDFLYNLEHVWSPSVDNWTGFPYQSALVVGDEEVAVERTGKRTMRMELPEPRANWLHADPFSYFIPAPKGLLKKYAPERNHEGLKKDEEVTQALYSGNLGPYRFEEWNRSSKLILARNDDYYLREANDAYAEAPHFERLVFQLFDDQSTALSGLEAGDVTFARLDERKAKRFENDSGTTVWTSRYGEGLFYVNVNQRRNGWDQLRRAGVRRALATAIDKDAVVETVLHGYAEPLDTFHPRWGPYYDESTVETYPPDVEAARSKLASATDPGYGYDGEAFVGPDGEQVELSMITVAGDRTGAVTADYVKQQFGELGVAVDVDSTKWTSLLKHYAQNSANHVDGVDEVDWTVSPYNGGPWDQSTSAKEWDLMYGLGFDHGAYDPWSVCRMLFTEKGSFNMTGYVPDASLEAKISTAAASRANSEAREAMAEVLGVISEEQPMLFMMAEHVLHGYDDEIGGLPDSENYFTTTYPEALDGDIYFSA